MARKKIVIIGGTHGIGKSLVERLSSHEVITIARSTEANYQWDVADLSQPLPQIEGPIHGLVYCPGTAHLKPFAQITAEDFQKDWQLNVLGAFRATKAFLKEMQKAETSSILFFSTVAVKVGMPFHASIAAAKGAIEGFTRSLAAELCPKIRVNAIAPSLTETPLVSHMLKSDSQRESIAKKHPLQRIGLPEDVSSLAAFLLSDEASWITGQVIGVDGGMSTLRQI